MCGERMLAAALAVLMVERAPAAAVSGCEKVRRAARRQLKQLKERVRECRIRALEQRLG